MARFDGFAKNYEELVTESVQISGESSEYFAAYKAAYAARVLSGKGIKKVLDYGCGVGALAKHLLAAFPAARIDGYDPSAESIGCVEDSLRKQGQFTASLEETHNDYDLVILSNVLHHIPPQERGAVLAKTVSKLAAGGFLLIFEHNPFNPLTRWAVSQCPFDDDAILLRSGEARRRVRLAGLQLARSQFIVFFPRLLAALRPLEPSLGWLPCGAQYAVIGVKPAA